MHRKTDPVRAAEREVLRAVLCAVMDAATFCVDQATLDKQVRRAGAEYLRALFNARGRIKAPKRRAAKQEKTR